MQELFLVSLCTHWELRPQHLRQKFPSVSKWSQFYLTGQKEPRQKAFLTILSHC